MADYETIDFVEGSYKDIPVKLLLQIRRNVMGTTYHLVSWRTRYPSGKSNRRFYRTSADGCWVIPTPLARDLLSEAAGKGMLSEKYDDLYERFETADKPKIQYSDALSEPLRQRLFKQITCFVREPNWGSNPRFVVGTEPGGKWRKILIVDSNGGYVTFRSTTKDQSYKPSIVMDNNSSWRMDNAMQDASTQFMRSYLEFLARF